MADIELTQENFRATKEIAKLHDAISVANVELIKLQADTEEYLVSREVRAEERVLKVLKESREALEETSTNHTELSNYSRDVQAYANELKVIATGVTTLFKDFNARVSEAEKDLDINEKLVSEVLKKIKIERVQIQEDRKMLERERKATQEGSRLLADRTATLERAWKEFKNLQNNQDKI